MEESLVFLIICEKQVFTFRSIPLVSDFPGGFGKDITDIFFQGSGLTHLYIYTYI